MFNQIRVYSVFSADHIRLCRDEGVTHFGFDYRPRELSFVPHDKVLEILALPEAKECHFYLHFGDEKEELWSILLEEIYKVISSTQITLIFTHLRGWSSMTNSFEINNTHWHFDRSEWDDCDALAMKMKKYGGELILNLLSYTSSFRVVEKDLLINDLRRLNEMKRDLI